jgi:hypothetical protein
MKTLRALILLSVLAAACGGDSAAPNRTGTPASVTVVAGDAQTATVGMPLATPVRVVVKDADGRSVEGVRIEWDVTEGDGFTLPARTVTDAAGNAGTTWYLGPRSDSPHRLLGRVTSTLAAGFSATALTARPDSTYFGRQQYIEYRPGELPLIISAPHGGTLTPAEVPDRTSGTFDRDTNAEETVRAIADAFQQRTGKRPHIVISRLRRIKLDPNREIAEAAGGSALAEHAWREWHTFLAAARAHVERGGSGFYIDFHGHGHPIARLELGYLLSAADLGLPDATLAGATYLNRSSIRALGLRSGHSFVSLLRGDQALGTLLQAAGYPSVPSRQQPTPGGDPYFSGGYNTGLYGSRDGGTVDGVQIEAYFAGVRDTPQSRAAFAGALVDVLQEYFIAHYGVALR